MNILPAAPEKEKIAYSTATAPWFFGAFLNQARHNLFLTVNDLAIRLGEKVIDYDDQLLNSNVVRMLVNEKASPLQLEILMKYLDRHLPFLIPMQVALKGHQGDASDNPVIGSPADYGAILSKLIVCLNAARNHFSHYHSTSGWSGYNEVIEWMEHVFTRNIETVVKRFTLTEEEVQHLKKPVDKSPKGTIPPYYFSFCKGDIWTDTGLAFFICLFLTREEAYLFLKKLRGFKRGEERFHKATLEAFCVGSLKVPRERLESNNSPQSAFLDMCNELVRCPKSLFDLLEPEKQELFRRDPEPEDAEDNGIEEEEDQPQALLVRKENRFSYFALRYLDIAKAFPRLRFGVDLGTYFFSVYPKTFAGIEETRQLSKRLIGYGKLEEFAREKRPEHIAALFRSKEEANAAPTEPFIRETAPHYHLDGNNVYLYMSGDGEAQWPAVELEEVTGKSYPRKLVKKSTLLPFAVLTVNELPALLFYHLLHKEKGAGDAAERVIINHMERVKRFFKALQDDKVDQVAGQPIRKPDVDADESLHMEYDRRWKLLKKKLSEYQLRASYIPEKIINYLLNIEAVDLGDKAMAQLKNLQRQAQDDIAAIERRMEHLMKKGADGRKTLKVGNLAQQLAEDMLQMQPVQIGTDGEPVPASKANNLAFRLLQSHLAYFAENRHNLPAVFEACGLIGASNKHPFLDNINIESCKGVVDFFILNFRNKLDFLDRCLQEGEWHRYHFISAAKLKSGAKVTIKKYLNEAFESKGRNHIPFTLPPSLFLDASLDWLAKFGDGKAKKVLAENEYVNSVFLIRRLFADGGLQPFYAWKREYRLFEKKAGKAVFLDEAGRMRKADKIGIEVERHREFLARPVKKGKQYDIKKAAAEQFLRSYRFYLQEEKYIRLLAAQDMLLFRCICDLLTYHVGDIGLEELAEAKAGTFSLANITPEKTETAKSLLNYRPAGGVVLDRHFYATDEKGAFVKQEGKLVPGGQVRIFDNTLKIKNAGNFRKLLKDRRMNNLFFYFKQHADEPVVLHRMVLENELRAYDRMRLKVLPVIAEFEKKLYQHCTDVEKERLVVNGSMHHRCYLDVYREKYQPDWGWEAAGNLLRIRNAFVHNQFPLMEGDGFKLEVAHWKKINADFVPSEQGSSLGYGIIDRLGQLAVEGYEGLIKNIHV